MSTPTPVRPPREPVNLARLATVFALIFSIAFGICSVSGISLSNGGNARAAELLIATGLVIAAVCSSVLAVIAVFAVLRSRRRSQ